MPPKYSRVGYAGQIDFSNADEPCPLRRCNTRDLGLNWHIGFNEPGTPSESLTHVAAIAPHTVAAKAGLFGSANNVPRWAITMGIKTIMEARAILLMANGSAKAEIIRQALQGPVTPEVPASVLQLHPNLWVVLDAEAGGELAES